MFRVFAAVVAVVLSVAGSMAVRSISPVHASRAAASTDLGLYANGWDAAYRSPFGAVPQSATVTFHLASSHTVTSAQLYLVNPVGAVTTKPMTKQSRKHGVKLWEVAVKMPNTIGEYGYYFSASAGQQTEWYGDNAAAPDGGIGQEYSSGSGITAYELTVYLKSFRAPPWMKNAVIYQIMPDRFFDGNPSNNPKNGALYGYIKVILHQSWFEPPKVNGPYISDFYGGDLQGVIDKLPYLHGLGITTIYLTPIFEAPSNIKYDTGNFKKIDPEFGTLQTFKTLVADAKKMGIHLILDGVFEDTGSDSVYFNEYNTYPGVGAYQSQSSPYYPWYTFTSWPNSYADWGGVPSLVLLNDIPSVENFIFRKPNSVAQYWLKQGASGWRLDSADSLTQTYWQAFRKSVLKAYPKTLIVAESNFAVENSSTTPSGAYANDAVTSLLRNGWDGVMNYQFQKSVDEFFANGNDTQFNKAMPASQFLDTQMSILDQFPRPAIISSMNLVDSHDTSRIFTDLNGSMAGLMLVALYQMTWLGTPTIFYGDETALTGRDNNEARWPFPWGRDDTSLEAYYSHIIHMRRNHPALNQGAVQPLLASDSQRVVAYLRQQGKQQIVVVLNDSLHPQTVSIPAPQIANGTVLNDLVTSGVSATETGGHISLTVPALTGRVLLAG
jgi:cyclomaltodextrinase / maltogenic alpha-amylase / neopullulanase